MYDHSLVERDISAADAFAMCRDVVAAGGAWRITVQGDSMLPTLASGSQVNLIACPKPVPIGAIVLAQTPYKIVLHRVIRRKAGQVLLVGDANRYVDSWIPQEGIAAMLDSWHDTQTMIRESRRQRWQRLVIAWFRYGVQYLANRRSTFH